MHTKHLGGDTELILLPVADIRTTFARTDDASLVGAGTGYPFAFTIPELDRLFRKVKKFTVSGDLPGQEDADTHLGNYPSNGLRQHLFANRWPHVATAETNKPVISIAYGDSQGYVYNPGDGDRYYPFFSLTYSGTEGEDEDIVNGQYTSLETDFGEAGEITLLGKTVTLYHASEPSGPNNPPGDISFEIASEWTL